MDRRALFASGAAAALLAAAGVSAGPLPQRGGKLRLALSGAQRSDDWLRGDGLFMQVARAGLVFDTLTEVAADGTLHGGLAVAWQRSADARIWQFDLRRGVRFHDGVAFTSADAVHSLAPLGEARSRGPHGIELELAVPDAALPFKLSRPEHVVCAGHGAGIGTGLYAVTHFAPGQQLLTQRVAAHWKDGQAGWFDRVELVSIPAADVRAQAVAEYLVDGADVPDTQALRGLRDIALWDGHAVSHRIALPLRMGRGPFDDLRAPQRWWGA